VKWLLVLTLVALSAPGFAQLRLEDARLRGLPPGQTATAGYALVSNGGDSDIVIVAAHTAVADRVEMHAHRHAADGMMGMVRVEQVRVPAQGRFRFEPGGHHLMVIGLKRPLLDGENVPVTLVSDTGLEYEASFQVISVLRESTEHSHH
jgi:copper(I)-binding protein